MTVKKIQKAIWRRALPFIGLLLVCWVLSKLNLNAIGSAFLRVPPSTLVTAALLSMSNVLLKGLRWQGMLRAQNLRVSVGQALAAFLAGVFWGTFSPGRAGEFLRANLLNRYGVDPARALASCIFDRALDLSILLLIGLGAVFTLLPHNARAPMVLAILSGVALAALVTFLWVKRRRTQSSARSLESVEPNIALSTEGLEPNAALSTVSTPKGARQDKQSVPWYFGAALLQKVSRFARILGNEWPKLTRPRALLEASLWSFAAWAAYFGSAFSLARGMGFDVSYLRMSGTTALAALSTLLPVTLHGIGAREIIFIKTLAAPAESCVALSFLVIGVFLVVSSTLGLMGLWKTR